MTLKIDLQKKLKEFLKEQEINETEIVRTKEENDALIKSEFKPER